MHKPRRQAPDARIRPRQWVGGPVQALRRLPGLGPDGKSGPTRVATPATPHGGNAAPNAVQHARAGRGTQRKLPAHESHTAHSIAEQSKAVYHNDGGGQPHHLPQAPAPAQHPTPRVGATPTAWALHPRPATAAHKQGAVASPKGRPRGLGLGPANGWAALSKRFRGYPNSAPTGGAALPG